MADKNKNDASITGKSHSEEESNQTLRKERGEPKYQNEIEQSQKRFDVGRNVMRSPARILSREVSRERSLRNRGQRSRSRSRERNRSPNRSRSNERNRSPRRARSRESNRNPPRGRENYRSPNRAQSRERNRRRSKETNQSPTRARSREKDRNRIRPRSKESDYLSNIPRSNERNRSPDRPKSKERNRPPRRPHSRERDRIASRENQNIRDSNKGTSRYEISPLRERSSRADNKRRRSRSRSPASRRQMDQRLPDSGSSSPDPAPPGTEPVVHDARYFISKSQFDQILKGTNWTEQFGTEPTFDDFMRFKELMGKFPVDIILPFKRLYDREPSMEDYVVFLERKQSRNWLQLCGRRPTFEDYIVFAGHKGLPSWQGVAQVFGRDPYFQEFMQYASLRFNKDWGGMDLRTPSFEDFMYYMIEIQCREWNKEVGIVPKFTDYVMYLDKMTTPEWMHLRPDFLSYTAFKLGLPPPGRGKTPERQKGEVYKRSEYTRTAPRDQTSRDHNVHDQTTHDHSVRDQSTRDHSVRDQFTRDHSIRDQTTRDHSSRDHTARDHASRRRSRSPAQHSDHRLQEKSRQFSRSPSRKARSSYRSHSRSPSQERRSPSKTRSRYVSRSPDNYAPSRDSERSRYKSRTPDRSVNRHEELKPSTVVKHATHHEAPKNETKKVADPLDILAYFKASSAPKIDSDLADLAVTSSKPKEPENVQPKKALPFETKQNLGFNDPVAGRTINTLSSRQQHNQHNPQASGPQGEHRKHMEKELETFLTDISSNRPDERSPEWTTNLGPGQNTSQTYSMQGNEYRESRSMNTSAHHMNPNQGQTQQDFSQGHQPPQYGQNASQYQQELSPNTGNPPRSQYQQQHHQYDNVPQYKNRPNMGQNYPPPQGQALPPYGQKMNQPQAGYSDGQQYSQNMPASQYSPSQPTSAEAVPSEKAVDNRKAGEVLVDLVGKLVSNEDKQVNRADTTLNSILASIGLDLSTLKDVVNKSQPAKKPSHEEELKQMGIQQGSSFMSSGLPGTSAQGLDISLRDREPSPPQIHQSGRQHQKYDAGIFAREQNTRPYSRERSPPRRDQRYRSRSPETRYNRDDGYNRESNISSEPSRDQLYNRGQPLTAPHQRDQRGSQNDQRVTPNDQRMPPPRSQREQTPPSNERSPAKPVSALDLLRGSYGDNEGRKNRDDEYRRRSDDRKNYDRDGNYSNRDDKYEREGRRKPSRFEEEKPKKETSKHVTGVIRVYDYSKEIQEKKSQELTPHQEKMLERIKERIAKGMQKTGMKNAIGDKNVRDAKKNAAKVVSLPRVKDSSVAAAFAEEPDEEFEGEDGSFQVKVIEPPKPKLALGKISIKLDKQAEENSTLKAIEKKKAEEAKKKLPPGFKCGECEKDFNSKQNLQRHIFDMHEVKKEVYRCYVCGHDALQERWLVFHMKFKHDISEMAVPAKDTKVIVAPYKSIPYCDVCKFGTIEDGVMDRHKCGNLPRYIRGMLITEGLSYAYNPAVRDILGNKATKPAAQKTESKLSNDEFSEFMKQIKEDDKRSATSTNREPHKEIPPAKLATVSPAVIDSLQPQAITRPSHKPARIPLEDLKDDGQPKCLKCLKKFLSEAELHRHEREVHAFKSNVYRCFHCGFDAVRFTNVQKHLLQHHDIDDVIPDDCRVPVDMYQTIPVCVLCKYSTLMNGGMSRHKCSQLPSYNPKILEELSRNNVSNLLSVMRDRESGEKQAPFILNKGSDKSKTFKDTRKRMSEAPVLSPSPDLKKNKIEAVQTVDYGHGKAEAKAAAALADRDKRSVIATNKIQAALARAKASTKGSDGFGIAAATVYLPPIAYTPVKQEIKPVPITMPSMPEEVKEIYPEPFQPIARHEIVRNVKSGNKTRFFRCKTCGFDEQNFPRMKQHIEKKHGLAKYGEIVYDDHKQEHPGYEFIPKCQHCPFQSHEREYIEKHPCGNLRYMQQIDEQDSSTTSSLPPESKENAANNKEEKRDDNRSMKAEPNASSRETKDTDVTMISSDVSDDDEDEDLDVMGLDEDGTTDDDGTKCPYCEEVLKSKRLRNFHIMEKHEVKTKVFRCPACYCDFPRFYPLKVHNIFKNHGLSKGSLRETGELEVAPYTFISDCPTCGFASLQDDVLANHKCRSKKDSKSKKPFKTLKDFTLTNVDSKDMARCPVCKKDDTYKRLRFHASKAHFLKLERNLMPLPLGTFLKSCNHCQFASVDDQIFNSHVCKEHAVTCGPADGTEDDNENADVSNTNSSSTVPGMDSPIASQLPQTSMHSTGVMMHSNMPGMSMPMGYSGGYAGNPPMMTRPTMTPMMMGGTNNMMGGASSMMGGMMDGTNTMMGGMNTMMGTAPMMGGANTMMGGANNMMGRMNPMMGGPSPMMGGMNPMMSRPPPMMGAPTPMMGGPTSMMSGYNTMMPQHGSMMGVARPMMGMSMGGGAMMQSGGAMMQPAQPMMMGAADVDLRSTEQPKAVEQLSNDVDMR